MARILGSFAVAALLIGLHSRAGAADTIPASSYDHPQHLVAVEGSRRLNLFCLGNGSPVVLMDAGTGGNTIDWRHVQGPAARITRACSYDRAGYGFSDPSRRPMDADNSVDDLHRLIAAAGLNEPIVLVSHSIGGLYATLFAQRYPAAVAGMVLVDPAFRESDDLSLSGIAKTKAAEAMAGERGAVAGTKRCLDLARKHNLPAMRVAEPPCLDDPPNPNPDLHRILDREDAMASFYEANYSEFRSEFPFQGDLSVDDRELGPGAPHLGSIPLVVLTRGLYPLPWPDFTRQDTALVAAMWKAGHKRLAAASTQGQEVIVAGSAHYIQNERPQVVVQAISSVVNAVRHATAGGQPN